MLFRSAVTRSKTRMRRAETPVVESLVRRCTRSSVKRDGFRPVSVENSTARKKIKRQPRKQTGKKNADKEKKEAQIREIPIHVMQQVGAALGIEADKLSEEVLKAPPSTPTKKSSNDDE